MPTATFDFRAVPLLTEERIADLLRASRSGPVAVWLTPGTQPAEKLARLLPGELLRRVDGEEWRVG